MFSVVSLLIISCPRIKDSLTIPLGGGAVTGTCFTSLPSFTSPLADVVTPTFASFFLNEFFVFSKPLLSPAVGLIGNSSFSFSTSGFGLGFSPSSASSWFSYFHYLAVFNVYGPYFFHFFQQIYKLLINTNVLKENREKVTCSEQINLKNREVGVIPLGPHFLVQLMIWDPLYFSKCAGKIRSLKGYRQSTRK